MPIVYAINVGKALIVTRCIGHVTLDEVKEHFRELAQDWPPVDKLDVLLDLTEETSLPTLRDLEEVAKEIDGQIGPLRFGRCAVVTEQGLLYESMEMFQVLAGRFFDAVEVFPTPPAAVGWLVPTPKPARALHKH